MNPSNSGVILAMIFFLTWSKGCQLENENFRYSSFFQVQIFEHVFDLPFVIDK